MKQNIKLVINILHTLLDLRPEDLVMAYYTAPAQGDHVPHRKLQVKWTGPHVVLRVVNQTMVQLGTLRGTDREYRAGDPHFLVHGSKIRLIRRKDDLTPTRPAGPLAPLTQDVLEELQEDVEGSEISITPAQPPGGERVKRATRGEEEGASPPQLGPPPSGEQGAGGGGGGGVGGWMPTLPRLPLSPPALPPLTGPGGVNPSPDREQEPGRGRERVTPPPSVHEKSVAATPTPGGQVSTEGRVNPQVGPSSRSEEQPTLPQLRTEQQASPQPNPGPALTPVTSGGGSWLGEGLRGAGGTSPSLITYSGAAARGAAALKKRVPPSLSKITKQTTGLLKGAGKGAFRILKAAREDPLGLTLRGYMEVERDNPEDLAWDNDDIGPWDSASQVPPRGDSPQPPRVTVEKPEGGKQGGCVLTLTMT